MELTPAHLFISLPSVATILKSILQHSMVLRVEGWNLQRPLLVMESYNSIFEHHEDSKCDTPFLGFPLTPTQFDALSLQRQGTATGEKILARWELGRPTSCVRETRPRWGGHILWLGREALTGGTTKQERQLGKTEKLLCRPSFSNKTSFYGCPDSL